MESKFKMKLRIAKEARGESNETFKSRMVRESNRKIGQLFVIGILFFAWFTGEVMCIYKACNSNWSPIGKREVIYTVAAATQIGCIVGWFNIEDK